MVNDLKNLKIPSVGISQIEITIPRHFIAIEELARRRKISSEYALKGLGVFRARIPYQISIEKLAAQALEKIDYQNVQRFYIGTESDYDASKPFSIKILNQELGLNFIPFQYKFACLAGLQALISACEYCVANKGKPVVVLAVDRSIYRATEPTAEITQGCAALAMKVEMNPRLLIVDYQNLGQYAQDIDDFKVPIFSSPFPKINGELTKAAYLGCQKMALEDWKKNNFEFLKKIKRKGKSLLEVFDFFIMHTPFPKIVGWAGAMFWRHEKLNQKEHLSLSDCIKNPSLFKEYKKGIDEIRRLPQFQEFFRRKIKPGLKYNSYIGNAYTGSIFISLISILEKIKRGQEIGINGYGSGAGSLCLRLIAVMKRKFKSDLKTQLKKGIKLTIDQYEEWRKKEFPF